MNYKDYIAIVEDFPKEGIRFKDITPLMQDGEVYTKVIDEIGDYAKTIRADLIVGPEARRIYRGMPACLFAWSWICSCS